MMTSPCLSHCHSSLPPSSSSSLSPFHFVPSLLPFFPPYFYEKYSIAAKAQVLKLDFLGSKPGFTPLQSVN